MPKAKAFLVTAALGLSVMTALAQDRPAVDPSIASLTNEQLVEWRQRAMMEDGMALRQANGATGAAAVEIATTVLTNFTNFPALFREGSITGDSEASPRIWQEWDTFNGYLTTGQDAAYAMLVAANANDTAGFQAGLQTLQGLCFQCHMAYREE